MKKLVFIGLALVLMSSGYSQDVPQQNAESKLQAARIALITERLGLTPEQAQKFWPLYNQYAQDRRQLQQEVRKARLGLDMQHLTEEQSKRLMKLRLDIKQKEVNLEKRYSNRLMDVISSRQLLALRKAEDDFRAMIIRRLEQRKRQQLQRDRMLRDRERRLRQGNN